MVQLTLVAVGLGAALANSVLAFNAINWVDPESVAQRRMRSRDGRPH